MNRDNRQSEREDIRTSAEAIVLGDEPKRIKIWTNDLSASGAKVLTREELDGTEFFVRFLLAGTESSLIAVEIIRHNWDEFRKLHEYAVRFLRVCSAEESERVLGEHSSPA